MPLLVLTRTLSPLLLGILLYWPQPVRSQTLAIAHQQNRPVLGSPVVLTRRLTDVLVELKTRFSVDILFEDRTLANLTVPADAVVGSTTLENALSRLLRPFHLRYKPVKLGTWVILNPKPPTSAEEKRPPVTVATEQSSSALNQGAIESLTAKTTSLHAAPEEISVSGTVSAVDNEGGLPGVSVVVKGTNRGTTTDGTGRYQLSIPTPAPGAAPLVLVYSYVGYVAQEIPVNNRTVINVELQENNQSLNEVVVIGYGTAKKSDLTGSVVSLRSSDFNKGGTNTSVAQLIQGRAPGVQVTQSSGAPGGGVSIRIRGSGSVNAGNEPLYVVDGFPIDNTAPVVGNGVGFAGNPPPTNPLNAINPSDIESIEILKDASAAAIYGSRGANGVVLITTRKGKDGRLTVNYSVTGSMARVMKKLDLLSTSDYLTTMNSLATARGVSPPFSTSQIQAIGTGTDWQDVIFRTAYTQDHNLSLAGGSGKTTFFSSFNYNTQQGILLNTDFNRYQGRLNLEHKASDKFKLGLTFNTSQITTTEVPTNSNAINQDADVINSAIVIPPIFSVYNLDGTYVRPESGVAVSVTVDNPLALANGISARTKTNRTLGNLYGEYTIIPGLSARLTLGSDRTNSRKDVYQSTITQRGNSLGGGASILTGELSNSLFEGLLNYQKQVQKHTLTALAGYTFQQFDLRRFNSTILGFPSDLTGTNSLQLGDTNQDDLNSLTTTRRLSSYLGRVNYNFDGKYLLTASFRADGSSNFGSNHRFGYFPSFAAAWRLVEENFIKNTQLFSDLKVRLGYGQIGNDDIGIGNSFATYSSTTPATFGSTQYTALAPTRIPNPDLKWETTEQYNAGIDFGFFGGRLTGSIDYFLKNTKDLLLNLPIPAATGFSVITTNIGQVRNSGVELALSSVNTVGAFKWNTSFNMGTLKNTVINTGRVPSIINTLYSTTAIARPGYPLFAYYGYQAEGIFQTVDEVANSAQKGVAVPGSPRWKDVNGDKKIDANDRIILGKSFPDFTYGLNNSISYKNFDLSLFVDGAQGFSLFNYQLVDALYPNDPYRNRLATPLLNRWTPQNPTNEWPSSIDYTKYGGGMVNNYTVTDASFFRIKNVQLSYRLPVSKVKFLQSATLTLSAQNLKTFTKYLGYDPDVNSTTSTIIRVDRSSYPTARTFSVGLNVKF